MKIEHTIMPRAGGPAQRFALQQIDRSIYDTTIGHQFRAQRRAQLITTAKWVAGFVLVLALLVWSMHRK